MTPNEIEKSIASAVNETKPDILEDLIRELDIDEEPNTSLSEALMASESVVLAETNRRKRWRHIITSCAAALVLAVSITAFVNNSGNEAFAVVGLDVNPSIELSIDKDEKVVSAKAINDDGTEILSDMDLEDTDVDVACNAIVGSMLTKGYLTDKSNGLLVSVNAEDDSQGREIEERLSASLNSYLGDSEIAAAILAQYVEGDDELEAFADENGISLGKAWLIRNLLDTGSTKMTEESLLNLSTQELILLGQQRNVASDVSYGEADTSEYIGNDKALAIALSDAGLSESQVSLSKSELDCDDGSLIYEVEFTSGGQEYEYDINAHTGAILFHETDVDDDDDIDDRDDVDDDDDQYDSDDDDDDRYESDDDDDNDRDDHDDDRDDHDDDDDDD